MKFLAVILVLGGVATSGAWAVELPVGLMTALAAGGVDSEGGKAIVCRNPNREIRSAELLDLFEGRILYQREPLPSNQSFPDQLKVVADRVQKIKPWSLYLVDVHRSAYEMFHYATMLPKGVRLGPTDDAIQVIIPEGCGIEQAASYNTRLQRLIIDSEIWEKFDEVNRTSLIMHETIYDALRRSSDEKDSFYTRQVVSYIMSKADLPSPWDGVPKTAYSCVTTPGHSSYPISWFYLYQDQAKHFVFQWIMVNKLPTFLPTFVRFAWGGNDGYSMDQLTGATSYKGNNFTEGSNGTVGDSNLAVIVGWDFNLRISYDAKTDNGKIRFGILLHRPGESGDNENYLPVQCGPVTDPRDAVPSKI